MKKCNLFNFHQIHLSSTRLTVNQRDTINNSKKILQFIQAPYHLDRTGRFNIFNQLLMLKLTISTFSKEVRGQNQFIIQTKTVNKDILKKLIVLKQIRCKRVLMYLFHKLRI